MEYKQFCALARAAEIVGERWTLLIIRELFLGPRRFTDLQRSLGEVSTSTLSERLARLEERRLIQREYMAPPAASMVYSLTPAGEALRPAVLELIRWGARYLLPRRPGERLEPGWLVLALSAYARDTATPARRFRVHLQEAGRSCTILIEGGPHGASVRLDDNSRADLTFAADAEMLLGLMSGRIDARSVLSDARLRLSGDTSALAEFPELFTGGREGM